MRLHTVGEVLRSMTALLHTCIAFHSTGHLALITASIAELTAADGLIGMEFVS